MLHMSCVLHSYITICVVLIFVSLIYLGNTSSIFFFLNGTFILGVT